MRKTLLFALFLFLSACGSDNTKLHPGKVNSVLYTGTGDSQPLIVGLGGSEGGNAWASERWKPVREKFIKEGYAFLAIGYFGGKETPEKLDRISIDAVHDAIIKALENKQIDKNKLALIGGSKGAELALLLASYYPDISCVVAMVPGNAAFPALTFSASTSSWTRNKKEVPYVPMPWAAVPAAIKHDLRRAFEIMREDTAAVKNALIKAENIHGPILFLSATKDEMWPSTEMSNEMMARLDEAHFHFAHKHIAINGSHTDVLDHFDVVLDFLNKNFRNN